MFTVRNFRVTSCSFTWVLVLMLAGCVTDQASQTGAPPKKITKPFLWHMTQSQDNFYLFGTIHTGVNAQTELPQEVWSALKDRPCFVTETNLDQVGEVNIAQYTQLPKGESLKAKLKPETWQYLLERLRSHVTEQSLDRMRPWSALLMLYAMDSAMYKTSMMDLALMNYARDQGKKILYFESMQDQLQAIDQVFTVADIEEYHTVGSSGLQSYAEQLLQWYRDGDDQKIAHMIVEPIPGAGNRPDQLEHLLYARNRKWLETLQKNPEYRQCFIAVGVGHLVGPKGMVSVLSH